MLRVKHFREHQREKSNNTGGILLSIIVNIGTVCKIEEETIDFAIKNVDQHKTYFHG